MRGCGGDATWVRLEGGSGAMLTKRHDEEVVG